MNDTTAIIYHNLMTRLFKNFKKRLFQPSTASKPSSLLRTLNIFLNVFLSSHILLSSVSNSYCHEVSHACPFRSFQKREDHTLVLIFFSSTPVVVCARIDAVSRVRTTFPSILLFLLFCSPLFLARNTYEQNISVHCSKILRLERSSFLGFSSSSAAKSFRLSGSLLTPLPKQQLLASHQASLLLSYDDNDPSWFECISLKNCEYLK